MWYFKIILQSAWIITFMIELHPGSVIATTLEYSVLCMIYVHACIYQNFGIMKLFTFLSLPGANNAVIYIVVEFDKELGVNGSTMEVMLAWQLAGSRRESVCSVSLLLSTTGTVGRSSSLHGWKEILPYHKIMSTKQVSGFVVALNIKLLEPLAQGASRFEKSLAPPKSTGPQFFQTT